MQDTVEEIVKKCPEAAEVLKSLGFDQITNPIMLKTMGKIMTLPKVSKAKKRKKSSEQTSQESPPLKSLRWNKDW